MIVFSLYFILIVFGFSFLSQSKFFNTILLAFGVIVLLYLSYDALNDFRQKKEIDLLVEKKNGKDNFISGILLSFGNPALLLILIGLTGADLSNNALSLTRCLLLGLGMILSYVVFFAGFILIIQVGKRYIHRKYLRFISLAASLILLYFSIKFGYKLIVALQ